VDLAAMPDLPELTNCLHHEPSMFVSKMPEPML
jgi:hypothetical protein